MDGVEVGFDALGKAIGPTHQAAESGSQGAKEAFGMVGLTFLLAAEAGRASGKGGFVGQPVGAARGPAAIIVRHLLAPAPGPFLAAVADGAGHDLAGASAPRDPQPTLLGLLLHAAPEFIGFEHVTVLAGQKRVLAGGPRRHFFPPPKPSRSGSRPRRGVCPRARPQSILVGGHDLVLEPLVVARPLWLQVEGAPARQALGPLRPILLAGPFLRMRSLPHGRRR